MHIIAFVIDMPAVTTILAHLGEPTAPPEIGCNVRHPKRPLV
jgi:hypothetical protein